MTPRLLIAEDHESARELIRHALEGQGFEMEFADDGPSALRAVEQRRFHAVLLDLALPEISGSEICRRLKSDPESASIPVIVMSGALGARELADEAARIGADAFLTKPFSLGELRTVTRAFTRLHAQALEIDRLRRELEAARAAQRETARLDWTLPYHDFMRLARKKYFLHALALAGGNKSRLARRSGLDRSTLYVHFRNLGMLPTKKKAGATSKGGSKGSSSETDRDPTTPRSPYAPRSH